MEPILPQNDREREVYEQGYLAALWDYAWWSKGTPYVGNCGTTYKEAVEKFKKEVM